MSPKNTPHYKRVRHADGLGRVLQPKIRRTEAEAIEVAARMTIELDVYYHAYLCPQCDEWHVGRPPSLRSRFNPLNETLRHELGDRAYVHTMDGDTLSTIAKRFDVITRRQAQLA